MELQYYIDQTPIDADDIKGIFPYPAALDFVSNTTDNLYFTEITNSYSDVDLTCLFTFYRRRADSEILLSKATATGGWTFGVTSGNFLYVDCLESGESHVFQKIFLGTKNCVVLKKSGQTFVVYKYDIVSGVIVNEESVTLSSDTLDESTTITIAGNYYYTTTETSIKYFNGAFDQLLYISEALDKAYILDLLLGFEPRDKTLSSTTSYEVVSQSLRFPDNQLSLYSSYFQSYFSELNSGLLTGVTGAGKWNGLSTGYHSTAQFETLLSLGTGLNACSNSGIVYSYLYTGAGIPDIATTNISDTVRISRNSNFVNISHNVVTSLSGVNKRVDCDTVYKQNSSSSYVWSVSGIYYTGFKMDGVNTLLDPLKLDLYRNEDTTPNLYNKVGVYNNTDNSFNVPDFIPGRIYLNGQEELYYALIGSNISFYSTYDSTSSVIYDNGYSLTGLHSRATGTYLTGNFYQNASILFSSGSTSGRLRLGKDYIETSQYHLYYKKDTQPSATGILFYL